MREEKMGSCFSFGGCDVDGWIDVAAPVLESLRHSPILAIKAHRRKDTIT
jgi:hypothetical protein